MSRSMPAARLGATLLGLCVAGAAFGAERPDFTGVWGNYRAPGAAALVNTMGASRVPFASSRAPRSIDKKAPGEAATMVSGPTLNVAPARTESGAWSR